MTHGSVSTDPARGLDQHAGVPEAGDPHPATVSVTPVALDAHSEQPDLSLPDDYKAHHPDEHPTDWGWHGEWGRAARVGGWVVAIILLLMMTATHYNRAGHAAPRPRRGAASSWSLIWDRHAPQERVAQVGQPFAGFR